MSGSLFDVSAHPPASIAKHAPQRSETIVVIVPPSLAL
jgi:hypothetical protein